MSPPYSPGLSSVRHATPTTDLATSIARQARRTGLIQVLRCRPDMTVTQLMCLVESSKYAEDLRPLQLRDLGDSSDSRLVRPHASEEDAVLRVFRNARGAWLSSGIVRRQLGLKRWTAQKVCADLAERGLLVRRGRTSATRYRLAESASIGSEV